MRVGVRVSRRSRSCSPSRKRVIVGGSEQAQAIWDSATSKIILGGSSNASDLRDLAQLIGERDHREVATTRQAGGGRNVSESTRQRAILDPSSVRLIKSGSRPVDVARGQTNHVDSETLDAAC